MKINSNRIEKAISIFEIEVGKIIAKTGLEEAKTVKYLVEQGVQTKDMGLVVGVSVARNCSLEEALDFLDSKNKIIYIDGYSPLVIMEYLEKNLDTSYEYEGLENAVAKKEAEKAKKAERAAEKVRIKAEKEAQELNTKRAKMAKEIAKIEAEKAAKIEAERTAEKAAKIEAEKAKTETTKAVVAKIITKGRKAAKSRKARKAVVKAIIAKVAAVKAVQAKVDALKAIEDAKEIIKATKAELVEVVNAAVTNDLDDEGCFIEVELAEAKLKAAKAELEAARKAFFKHCPSRQCKDRTKRTELAAARFSKFIIACGEATKVDLVKPGLKKADTTDATNDATETSIDTSQVAAKVEKVTSDAVKAMKEAVIKAGTPCENMDDAEIKLAYEGLTKTDHVTISSKATGMYIDAINQKVIDKKYDYAVVLRKVVFNVSSDKSTEFLKSQKFELALANKMNCLDGFNAQTKWAEFRVIKTDDRGNKVDDLIIKTGVKNCKTYGHMPVYDKTLNWENNRFIDDDVILLQVKSYYDGQDAAFFRKYVSGGFFVGKTTEGELKLYPNKEVFLAAKKLYDEEMKDSGSTLEWDGFYAHFINSASSLKIGECLLAKLEGVSMDDADSCNKTYRKALRKRVRQLYKISGWALHELIKDLENQRRSAKKGSKVIKPSKYSKILSRAGLWYTPSLSLGHVHNFMLIRNDLDKTPADFEGRTAEVMAKFEIGSNFSDGTLQMLVDTIKVFLSRLLGYQISNDQAMALLPQIRVKSISGKGIAQGYDRNMMAVRAENAIWFYDVDIHVNKVTQAMIDAGLDPNVRHYDNYRKSTDKYKGANLMDLTEEQRRVLFSEMELMSSDNESKAISDDALAKGVLPEVCLVDAIKSTETNTSNQSLNKITDVPEICKKTMRMSEILMREKIDEIIKQDSKLSLSKDCKSIKSRALDYCLQALGDAAKTDMAIMSNKLRNDINGLRAAIGRARMNYQADYLAALPADLLLTVQKDVVQVKDKDGNVTGTKIERKFLDVLTARDMVWCSPEEMEAAVQAGRMPETKTIRVYEIFSSGLNRKIAKRIEKFKKYNKASGKYTPEQEKIICELMRMVTVIKYPSQGTNEFVIAYCVSNKDVLNRIANMKLSENEKKAAKSAYCKSPESAVIFGCNNGIKQALAGFDFDGDAVAIIPTAIRMKNNMATYGLVDIKTGEVVDDYNSLIVQKFIHNGYKYIKTVIIYPKNPPIRYTEDACDFSKKPLTCSDSYNDEIKAMVTMERSLTGNRFKRSGFLKDPAAINSINKIKDILGLYAASNECGDDIGLTIVLCSVIIMNTEMFKDGVDAKGNPIKVFDYDLFLDLFEPLKISRVNRKYRYRSVFVRGNGSVTDLKTSNLEEATDRFGIKSDYYAVTKEVIDKFIQRMKELPSNTTEAEWKQVVNDFIHITRALGESSIDVKKDIEKAFGIIVTKIIYRYVRCLGNVKTEHITYNNHVLSNSLHKDDEFVFRFDKFRIEVMREDDKYKKKGIILMDPIGEIKEAFRVAASNYVNKSKNNMVANEDATMNASYGFYAEHYDAEEGMFENSLMYAYPATSALISTVVSYLLKASIPRDKDEEDKVYITKLSADDKKSLLSIIYNTAVVEGMKVEDVIKLAIQHCFYAREAIEGSLNNEYHEYFDFDRYYSAKLNTVINFFNEIFIVERLQAAGIATSRTLPVEVIADPNSKRTGINNGNRYNFKNGVCVEYPSFKLLQPVTGEVLITTKGKIVYGLSPEAHILPEIPVFGFAIKAFAGTPIDNLQTVASEADFKMFDPQVDNPFGYNGIGMCQHLWLVVDTLAGEERVFIKSDDGVAYLAILDIDPRSKYFEEIRKTPVKLESHILNGYSEIIENTKSRNRNVSIINKWFITGLA